MGIMLLKSWHWLESTALVVLVVGPGAVALLVLKFEGWCEYEASMLGNASDVHDGVDVEALAYLVIVIIMRAFAGTLTNVMVNLECRQHHDSCRLDLKLRGSVFARCAWVPPSLVGAGSMSRVCCHRLSATGSGSMLSLPTMQPHRERCSSR